MADVHGSPADAPQNPQADTPGSAPVPYHGGDQSPEPPTYAVDLGPMDDAAGHVMAPIPAGNSVMESGVAHDIAAGLADAPYYPGSISPIYSPVNGDADEQDDVSGTVGGAVAAASARWGLAQQDTYQQGSVIGDLMALPPSPLDPGVGSLGQTSPMGSFYDPPRQYTTDPSA